MYSLTIRCYRTCRCRSSSSLFGLTLAGVAVVRPSHTFGRARQGSTAIVGLSAVLHAFPEGPGLRGIGGTSGQHEWVIVANLACLLLGFAILSRHFEEEPHPVGAAETVAGRLEGLFRAARRLSFVLSSFLDNIAGRDDRRRDGAHALQEGASRLPRRDRRRRECRRRRQRRRRHDHNHDVDRRRRSARRVARICRIGRGAAGVRAGGRPTAAAAFADHEERSSRAAHRLAPRRPSSWRFWAPAIVANVVVNIDYPCGRRFVSIHRGGRVGRDPAERANPSSRLGIVRGSRPRRRLPPGAGPVHR